MAEVSTKNLHAHRNEIVMAMLGKLQTSVRGPEHSAQAVARHKEKNVRCLLYALVFHRFLKKCHFKNYFAEIFSANW